MIPVYVVKLGVVQVTTVYVIYVNSYSLVVKPYSMDFLSLNIRSKIFRTTIKKIQLELLLLIIYGE